MHDFSQLQDESRLLSVKQELVISSCGMDKISMESETSPTGFLKLCKLIASCILFTASYKPVYNIL